MFTIYMKTNVCLNVVTGDGDQPEAVLIRAGQVLEGAEEIKGNRLGGGRNLGTIQKKYRQQNPNKFDVPE